MRGIEECELTNKLEAAVRLSFCSRSFRIFVA